MTDQRIKDDPATGDDTTNMVGSLQMIIIFVIVLSNYSIQNCRQQVTAVDNQRLIYGT